ncbi:hypothetical protein VTK73DRAFT_8100 [Phialemonium thermophilum]|uniref:Vps72/YL1 C-terminal domain-containing protein n=1 Tax=Phialemonium thermophilum TaxID=223376 RepID=A0ABR3WAN7_9PEZI
MATDKDGRSQDEPSGLEESDSGNDGDSGSSSGSGSDSGETERIEWLATARTRRSTAGNRMKAMLANEELTGGGANDDSDLELLFAEDDDDAGFTDVSKEDASDVQMDSSSSDEEDEQAAGAADDLEGERELQREARATKLARRKRKAQDTIPLKFRKKVRIAPPPAPSSHTTTSQSPAPGPSTSAAPQPRPKKKSERASWLPSPAEMPTRASERHTTRLSKEQLHQQMLEREMKRKKQMEMLEKKAKRLEALKKPPMTQAERLAEAAIVEERNSKSLNRWEEAEKQREEERLRKIAALNNRKLDGPVVTFWSGIQELEEGQMKHIGKMVSIEEKAPRKKRQSTAAVAASQQQQQEAGAGKEPEPKPGPTERAADPKKFDELGAAAQHSSSGSAAVSADPSTFKTQSPPVSASQPAEQPQPVASARTASPPGGPFSQVEPIPPDRSQSLPPPASAMSGGLAAPTGPMAPPPMAPQSGPRPSTSGVLVAPVLALPPGAIVSMHGSSPMSMPNFSSLSRTSNVLAAPNTVQRPSSVDPAPPAPPSQSDPPPAGSPPGSTPQPLSSNASEPNNPPQPLPAAATVPPRPPTPPPQSVHPIAPPPSPPLPPPPPPPVEVAETKQEGQTASDQPFGGKVTKNCIILQNFDEEAIKDRQVQTQIIFGRKMNRLAKPAHHPLCVITSHPARYRDPKTGLPYSNGYAYKEIQRLTRGDYRWSCLIGAWVGSGTLAARGVPERFLNPAGKRTTPRTTMTTTEGAGVALPTGTDAAAVDLNGGPSAAGRAGTTPDEKTTASQAITGVETQVAQVPPTSAASAESTKQQPAPPQVASVDSQAGAGSVASMPAEASVQT